MSNRAVPAVLIVLLVIVHAQLWFGRGSVPNVTSLQRKVDQQRAANNQARLANSTWPARSVSPRWRWAKRSCRRLL